MPRVVMPQERLYNRLHNRPERNTPAQHEIRDQVFVDAHNDSRVDGKGNAQPDESVYQELLGALFLKRSRRKIPGQQEEGGHEIRLVKGIEKGEKDRTDVINCRVAQIPVSQPTIGKIGMNQNHHDSEIDPEIIQVK